MLYVAAVYVVYVECQADFVEGSNLERCYYNDADKKKNNRQQKFKTVGKGQFWMKQSNWFYMTTEEQNDGSIYSSVYTSPLGNDKA